MRVGPRVRCLLLTGLVVAAACSGADDADPLPPPPVTRSTIPPRVSLPDPSELVAPVTDPADGSADATDAESATPLDYSIVWEDRGNGVEAGFVTVPLDYSDPQGDTLDLRVVRHRAPADDRVGVLFANNGGPGLPASSMAATVRGWFGEPLIERFDIVTWDPRGTGESGASVDCIDGSEYDRYFGSSDVTPEDDAERDELIELSRDFAEACIDAVGDSLAHLGTNNSARDMDAIRQALGEDQASYLGFSYGSELGAVWATLFPDTVRAAVLDGAAHPDADGLEPTRQQRIGFETVLNTFLAECSANESCAFHNDGDAEGAFDALLESLDESPIPSAEGRPDVNLEIAINGVIQAMYTEGRWSALERALDDAANGIGGGLLALHDGYFQRDSQTGTYSNLLESFQAITCADDPDRLTPDESDAEAAPLIGVAPRLFPYTTASYTCDFFPASADPRAEITGDRAGPVVVIGTTGDPSTPLESSQAMADALEDGHLVTVEANRHTAYRTGDCINDIVHQYLIWLEVPAPDTRCT
ncbi:alpha/beta fold hydrolase [Ilumatobacter coccineus]|uniref:alpha/beta fold hydrolase n=1 Tax=Ilumatobacter coccineus TaxID=467094 RepID=UPI0012B6837A|nr:alpha/beta hydrolase [Ilumatobacter coccineus]